MDENGLGTFNIGFNLHNGYKDYYMYTCTSNKPRDIIYVLQIYYRSLHFHSFNRLK